MTRNHRRRILLSCLLLGTALRLAGADAKASAGGVSLTLPPPAAGFIEAEDRFKTTVFELLVPSTNRLLTAYAPAGLLDALRAGKADGMEMYAMVEVPRGAEYADCTPEAFAQVLKSAEPSLGSLTGKKANEFVEEMNARLKTLGSSPIEVGQPLMLGGILQKPDAAAFAMLAPLTKDGKSVTMATGLAMLRIKNKLVFAYLYRKYQSPETVDWLRENLEAWCDSILAKNQ